MHKDATTRELSNGMRNVTSGHRESRLRLRGRRGHGGREGGRQEEAKWKVCTSGI
jgi:hypothetical protein